MHPQKIGIYPPGKLDFMATQTAQTPNTVGTTETDSKLRKELLQTSSMIVKIADATVSSQEQALSK